MSYWSDFPELYDEIIFEQMMEEGLATEDDDQYETVSTFMKKPDSYKLAIRAERRYWDRFCP